MTSLRALQDRLVMQRVGCGDQHQVDVRMLNHLTPLGGDQIGAVDAAGLFQQILAARAQGDDGRVLR